MHIEKPSRSIFKTISWRITATMTTASIVFLFTGRLLLAVSVGSFEAIAKIILYFFHERAWNKIPYGRRTIQPCVVWLTGLSGSGKSTLAHKAYTYLQSKKYPVERLDGDVVRSIFPKTGFSKEERDTHVKRIGFLASMLERNGVFVVASFVSPYREARTFVRNLCHHFVEVHVKASVETCESRDVKGLYKKARNGEIKGFTGIDDPYEDPESPELLIDTNHASEKESFETIKKFIDEYIQKQM